MTAAVGAPTGSLDSLRRRGLAVGAGVVSLSAAGGALGLITGGADLGATVTGRLPWQSPVLGGVMLALWVAVPFAALAWAAWSGSRSTDLLAIVAGSLLVVWILVELAFIRTFSPIQPVCALVGVLVARVGVRARPATR